MNLIFIFLAIFIPIYTNGGGSVPPNKIIGLFIAIDIIIFFIYLINILRYIYEYKLSKKKKYYIPSFFEWIMGEDIMVVIGNIAFVCVNLIALIIFMAVFISRYLDKINL